MANLEKPHVSRNRGRCGRPVRPVEIGVHVMGRVSELAASRVKGAGAAPVQVRFTVLPLRVTEVIMMSGTKAKVVIACPKVPSCRIPTKAVLQW